MQNHVTKKVFQNSKILHFLGVKSEIYHREIISSCIIVNDSSNSRIRNFENIFFLFFVEIFEPRILKKLFWKEVREIFQEATKKLMKK